MLAGLGEGELAVAASAFPVGLPAGLVRADLGLDLVHTLLELRLLEFAFPYRNRVPFKGFQPLVVEEVSFLVAGYLRLPEFGPRLRNHVFAAALVSMPEAAVDEDGGAVAGKYDVGAAWEGADVDAESEAPAP